MAVWNPQESINRILGYKRAWDAGDEKEKSKAAANAKKYYAELEKNGYGNVAKELQSSDSSKAAEIANRYATAGMTGMRAGLKDGLKRFGITGKAADDLITYNPNTGDVFLGSVNVGKGDAFVNDTNYVYDPKRLDDAVSEWAKNTGTYSLTDRYNRNMDSATGFINNLQGMFAEDRDTANGMHQKANDYLYSDFTGTDAYDAIMNGYRELGKKAGYSAVANSAGVNGGNVDSYAQAQAARQMKSFENAGNAAALDYWNSKVNAILGEAQNYDASRHQTVSDGLNIVGMQGDLAQQDWNNYQQGRLNDNTIANDEYDRLTQMSDATGYVPLEWQYKMNPYLNDDGTLKEEYKNYDFQAAINNTTDETQKNYLAQAREVKMVENPDEYGQWAGTGTAANWYEKSEPRRKSEQDSADTRYGIAAQKYIDELTSNNALKASLGQIDADSAANEADLRFKYDELAADKDKAQKDYDARIKEIIAQYGDPDAPITAYTVEDLSKGFSASNGNVYVSGDALHYGVDKTGAALLSAVANVADKRGGVLTDAEFETALQSLAQALDVSDEQLQAVRKYLMVSAGYIPFGGTSSGESWD